MLRTELSRLKVVSIGEPVPVDVFEGLAGHVLEAVGHVVHTLEIVTYTPPPIERIEASLLTRALEQEVGGHILAVTEVDLLDDDATDGSSFMFGGKDNRNDVAVVSTKRLASRRGAPVWYERILKVALHELGHNFGLSHHYPYEKSIDGAWCPMSKGDYNGYGERGYVRAIIDGRGVQFCRRCLSFLERAVPA